MMRQPFWRLAKGTLVYGIGGTLNRLIGFLLLPLFTSYLTPVDYGISSILGLIAFLVTPMFSLGVGASIGIFYFQGNSREKKKMTIWTTFIMLTVSVSVLAVFGSLFAREISALAFGTPQYGYLVKISLITTCLTILCLPFGLYFQFEEEAKLFVVLATISTLVTIGFSILMVVFLKRGVEGLIVSGLIGQAITLALFFLPVFLRIKFGFSRRLCNEILKLGIPLIPAFAFLYVIQHGNKYLLQWFGGLSEVGVYTIGFNLGAVMSLLVNGFTNAWMPYFMSFIGKEEEASTLFGRILTYYVFIFGSISLLFYVFAKPVVMLMTTRAFWESYKVVGFSASAQFLMGAFSILVAGLYFAREVKYVTPIQALSALVSVGLNLAFIPFLGLLGAAIALMMSALMMNILQQAWNFKQRSHYLRIRYEWKRISWFAMVYAGFVVLLLLKRNVSWPVEILISTIATGILPIPLYALLNQEERTTLWNLLKRFAPRISSKVSVEV